MQEMIHHAGLKLPSALDRVEKRGLQSLGFGERGSSRESSGWRESWRGCVIWWREKSVISILWAQNG